MHGTLQWHVQSQNYMHKIIKLYASKVSNKDSRMTSVNLTQLPFLLILNFFQAHFNVFIGDSNVTLIADPLPLTVFKKSFYGTMWGKAFKNGQVPFAEFI